MLRLSVVCVVLALIAVSLAEPPASGGYPDRRNGNGGGSGGGGGGGGGGGAGGYQQVPSGQQTSEGQSVDAQLLEMVKMLLLQHESESSSGQSNGNGNGAPYGSYGPPAGSSSQGRVTAIELENPRQSMQVAEFWQGGPEQAAPGGGSFGGSAPSGSYGAPSDSYGAPLGRK
ncbi:pro-resilin-like [Topomyia yanbarensis]|uniref:pro-resilin-like n=1 Tax=Topomyia yanbarensis TaxID=2498891 RepID=UPI00273C7568|nr:pro-resilin-like [Topomyia yanbarensis]